MPSRRPTIAMESSPSVPNIRKQTIAAMTPESVAELAARLEADSYNSPFEALQDWHLLRAIALQRPDLAEDYHYLLDFEAFDEA